MATVSELKAKAFEIENRAKAKLNEITDTTSREDAAHIEAEFDRMIADADAARANADRLDKIEARAAAYTAADPRRPLHDGEARASKAGDDYASAFESVIRYGEARASSEARSILSRGEVRDGQVVGTANLGGNTVPTTIAKAVIVAMKAYGPFADPSVCNYVVTDSGAPITYPTMDDTSNSGSMIAEATAASGGNVTLGGITLNAYKATSGTFKLSSELLTDSVIDFVELVSNAMGERMGRLINAQATTGTGSSAPTGILTAVGTPTNVSTPTNDIVWEDVMATLHAVDPAYRNGPKVAFMFNDATLLRLRKLKDSQGRFLWEPGLTVGDPGSIYGKPYAINQNLPNIATGNVPILFGDWSKFSVRMSRSFAIQRLNELYAASDQVGFLGFLRLDSNLMDPRAIKGLKVS